MLCHSNRYYCEHPFIVEQKCGNYLWKMSEMFRKPYSHHQQQIHPDAFAEHMLGKTTISAEMRMSTDISLTTEK